MEGYDFSIFCSASTSIRKVRPHSNTWKKIVFLAVTKKSTLDLWEKPPICTEYLSNSTNWWIKFPEIRKRNKLKFTLYLSPILREIVLKFQLKTISPTVFDFTAPILTFTYLSYETALFSLLTFMGKPSNIVFLYSQASMQRKRKIYIPVSRITKFEK